MRNGRLGRRVLGMLVAILALPAVGWAQPDYSGRWQITLTAEIGGQTPEQRFGATDRGTLPPRVCSFTGLTELAQTSGPQTGEALLTGVVDLNLNPGSGNDPECPMNMSAMLEGTGTDSALRGTLTSPDLGTASFSGGPDMNPTSSPGALSNEAKVEQANHLVGPLAGPLNVVAGPFLGAVGNWAAVAIVLPTDIPMLSPLGLATMTLLLVMGGALLLRRQL